MTIYLVEDEENIRQLVEYTLRAAGFEARGFDSAPPFYTALAEARPDLALLDIMLPGESGLDILRRLRANESTARLPVMMLTARGAEYDKVLGLDAGADDYLAKPFGMMELVSRVKALLRRAAPQPQTGEARLVAGEVVLVPGRHSVTAAGRPVQLTLKEFELLRLLMEHPGLVFARDTILERVWDYAYEGETRTVDVHIRALRQKLGEGLIETVRGVGYRIAGGEGTGEAP